jgi:hypothetical protein
LETSLPMGIRKHALPDLGYKLYASFGGKFLEPTLRSDSDYRPGPVTESSRIPNIHYVFDRSDDTVTLEQHGSMTPCCSVYISVHSVPSEAKISPDIKKRPVGINHSICLIRG